MLKTSDQQFKEWLTKPEGLNLEFKKAENSFSESKDLPDYCAALANEGGGKLILGVTNDKQITGTKAFEGNTDSLSHKILQIIKIRVDVEETIIDDKRILIFHVPSRPIATIISSGGDYRYPMRAGSSLVEMTQEKIREIHSETQSDFSTQIVPKLAIDDMDPSAVDTFKALWARQQNNDEYLNFSMEKVLSSIHVLSDEGINYAGLVLFAKSEKISELLPGAEIIFEWRQEEKIGHDFRKEWRVPFFSIFDDIWATINARNIRFPFQEGFIQREVFAFNEKTIREAVLNAVTHRDYNIQSQSVFIKASPEQFLILSPGGFVKGITAENILNRSAWRNRRIAEVLQMAGLVERAGQGMDTIFGNTIREGKGVPDFSGSDNDWVSLHIPAKVKDEQFILFLEKVTNDKQITLSFEEICELESIREHQKVTDVSSKEKFLSLGIIEKVGRTSGAKYILSHKWYQYKERPGLYTKIVGLSREKNKELILTHLIKNPEGAKSADFQDALGLDQKTVNNMLQELKQENKVRFEGAKASGKWFIASS